MEASGIVPRVMRLLSAAPSRALANDKKRVGAGSLAAIMLDALDLNRSLAGIEPPRRRRSRATHWCGGFVHIILATSLTVLGADASTPANGRELARKYCASCHLFPEPNHLDKTTWKNGALPF